MVRCRSTSRASRRAKTRSVTGCRRRRQASSSWRCACTCRSRRSPTALGSRRRWNVSSEGRSTRGTMTDWRITIGVLGVLVVSACQAPPAPAPAAGTAPAPTAATGPAGVTAAELERRAIERRATEVVVWSMPAVNYELLTQEMVRIKAQWNQIVYWSRLPDWKDQTLTPNPDTTYF